MKNLTDLEIIESVIRGNHSDFSLLVDRYKNKAFSLLKRMLKNEMEAEEVLQDCFLKAFNALKNFKRESKFSTWFYRIVYNSALTRLSIQKRKIINEMSSIDDHLNLFDDSDYTSPEKKDISVFINKIINKLPEKYAAVITMFYLEEMTCEEISNVMQVSVSNVKVMLHRSRNILRDIVVQNKYLEEIL